VQPWHVVTTAIFIFPLNLSGIACSLSLLCS
jgi:hypothetical protein